MKMKLVLAFLGLAALTAAAPASTEASSVVLDTIEHQTDADGNPAKLEDAANSFVSEKTKGMYASCAEVAAAGLCSRPAAKVRACMRKARERRMDHAHPHDTTTLVCVTGGLPGLVRHRGGE